MFIWDYLRKYGEDVNDATYGRKRYHAIQGRMDLTFCCRPPSSLDDTDPVPSQTVSDDAWARIVENGQVGPPPQTATNQIPRGLERLLSE